MKKKGSFFTSKVGIAILKNSPIILSIIAVLVFAFFGRGQTTVSFTTPGTYTWTVPSCVTSITVQVWGAGGGGGGAWVKMDNSTTDSFGTAIEACAGGGGGGGGGFSTQTFVVVPGQTYTIVVGAGGVSGSSVTTPLASTSVQNGGNGGLSSFSGNSYNLVANGGVGGGKAYSYNSGWPTNHLRTGGPGGAGGTGTTFNGGTGSLGTGGGSFDHSGAGGGGAGTSGNGGNANSSTVPHTGGTGVGGGGNGANGFNLVSGVNNGANGNVIGGGAAGGVAHTTGYCNPAKIAQGGTGARGEVRIIYTGIASPTVAGPGTEICSGSSATIIASGSFTTYTWNTGQSGSSVLVSPTTNTTYTVTGTDASGCTASNSIAVSVKPAPNATAGVNDATICAGDAITLSAGTSPVNSTTTINFEGSNPFTLLNGARNNWYHGTFAKCNGSYGLYVGTASTNNNYVNYASLSSQPAVNFAYMDIPITECNASLSFNWKCLGKSTDNLSVWIIPTSVLPNVGTALTNGGSILKIGGDYWNSGATCNAVSSINLIQGWVTSGQTIRLVFQWKNSGSSGFSNTASPPAAMIDDIVINQTSSVTYSWSSSATPFTSTAQNPTNSPSASTIFTLTATGCNGCTKTSSIGVVVDPCGLPIELLSFQGSCTMNSKVFYWTTASESNNDYFVLEQSENGADFYPTAQIDGAGNSTDLLNYQVELDKIKANYFRLKQVDFDGAFSYSDIIYVNCESQEDQTIFFPNPFENELSVDLKGVNEAVIVCVLDVDGRLIKQIKREYLKSNSALNLDLSDLAKGIYYIELFSIESNELLKKGRVIKL